MLTLKQAINKRRVDGRIPKNRIPNDVRAGIMLWNAMRHADTPYTADEVYVGRIGPYSGHACIGEDGHNELFVNALGKHGHAEPEVAEYVNRVYNRAGYRIDGVRKRLYAMPMRVRRKRKERKVLPQ